MANGSGIEGGDEAASEGRNHTRFSSGAEHWKLLYPAIRKAICGEDGHLSRFN